MAKLIKISQLQCYCEPLIVKGNRPVLVCGIADSNKMTLQVINMFYCLQHLPVHNEGCCLICFSSCILLFMCSSFPVSNWFEVNIFHPTTVLLPARILTALASTLLIVNVLETFF